MMIRPVWWGTVCLAILSVRPLADAAEVSSPRHKVIAADKGKIVWFDEQGRVQRTVSGAPQVHRIQVLEGGHVLTQLNWHKVVELDADRKVVWSYDSSTMNGNAGKEVEVHAFQRLPNGATMIVENGVGRIIEVDREGRILHDVKFHLAHPSPHRDVRQACKLSGGTYLVCHEAEGRVTEYDGTGRTIWNYNVPLFGKEPRAGHGPKSWGNQVFNARRLKSGNTLIATGNGHSVIEVTPGGEIVWAVHQHDLPGITLAWTTTLEVLDNGNLLIGNCHAGPQQPQLIEITRGKEVVWTFYDFDVLGDSTAASTIID